MTSLDQLFHDAVAAMDAGDLQSLDQLLVRHSRLVRERLAEPGAWLRDLVGDTLQGYFAAPWLLWFVAGNPVRQESLPPHIARIACAIIEAARREPGVNLQEQLEYTLLARFELGQPR